MPFRDAVMLCDPRIAGAAFLAWRLCFVWVVVAGWTMVSFSVAGVSVGPSSERFLIFLPFGRSLCLFAPIPMGQ